MLKPRRLYPGDRLAIVAPASPFEPEDLEAGIAEVRRLGFVPVYDERIFERRGYLAGETRVRAAALRDALEDPTIAGILTARGGFGSVQLLPSLDAASVVAARKMIVGYSDVTSLLTFISCACGLVCAHGPSVASRLGGGIGRYDAGSFLATLTSTSPLGPLGGELEGLQPGEARGPIFGGNMTQLAASLGTPYAFDPPAGCILLLEEVNERPYRIERVWTQLLLAGVVARASGIVFGDFPGCDEPGETITARALVARLVEDFPGPVALGLRTGHTPGPALTVPLGVESRLIGGSQPVLILEEAAVADL
jgi:muramoyltetrapeptide carboxypeptidase